MREIIRKDPRCGSRRLRAMGFVVSPVPNGERPRAAYFLKRSTKEAARIVA